MSWQDKTKAVMDACLDAFGEEITYTPADGGDPVVLDGIFDEAFESVDAATGLSIISQQPIIGIKIADLPYVPTRDDVVSIRGIDYRVVEPQHDGQAGYRILLHKQP